MAERQVEFNALPREVRRRLTTCLGKGGQPQPIISDLTSTTGAAVGLFVLSVAALVGILWVAATDYGSLWSGIQSGLEWHALYMAGVFILVGCGLAGVRRIMLGKKLPYRPGRYLLPLDYVETKGTTLRMLPLGDLVDFSGTHHHTNGSYTHTALVLTFEGGKRINFSVSPKAKAESVLKELQASRVRLMTALESEDVGQVAKIDPFFEVRVKDAWAEAAPGQANVDARTAEPPHAEPLHPMFETGSRIALTALVAALVLGPMISFVRNRLSDGAMFSRAEGMDTEDGFKLYLERGGSRFATIVRTELQPRAALREAKAKGSVTELRGVLSRYPGSVVEQETRDEIHALFVATLEKFRGQASTTNPDLLPFMEALIAYLEKVERSEVHVRFGPPTSDVLAEVDKQIQVDAAGMLGRPVSVAPVAGHFDEASSQARESAIAKNLADGFRKVFPADILDLREGPRLASDGRQEATEIPSLDIHYEVKGSGQLYTSQKNPNRGFVGISVTFSASLRIPGKAETLDFVLAVEPPEQFSVEYQSSVAGLAIDLSSFGGGAGGGPSDNLVYQVMALRAFDMLAAQLQAVFFKQEEAAEAAPPGD